MKSLLIGCGNSRQKKVILNDDKEWLGELVTIDMDPNCGATHILDMSVCSKSMPFPDDEFDEIHAYDVLEHWGAQGDWRAWFDEFSEYHRILKPNGTMGIIVPIGNDAFGDPGHSRFIHANHFAFLNQAWYQAEIERGSPVTDYRWYWKKNFELVHLMLDEEHHIGAVLRKA